MDKAEPYPTKEWLFVAEGFGGVEMGGAVGGEYAEDEAHEAGDAKSHGDGDGRNGDTDIGEQLHAQGDGHAHEDAEQAAGEAHQDGLGEELQEDLLGRRADGSMMFMMWLVSEMVTTRITEAVPMAIPSPVRTERTGLARSACQLKRTA
jgi:hypothetical protein